MKKFIFIIALICLLIPTATVLASDTSSALFYGTVRVTNNGTATTGVATNFSGNTTAWQAVDYLNASCNNSAILSAASADLPYMPGYAGNPWIVYVPSIGESAQLDDTLYMGGSNTMSSKICYFGGSGGMTTSDDASIELGDNGTITLSDVFVDTTAGAGKYIFYKEDALEFYVDSVTSGTINAEIPELLDQTYNLIPNAAGYATALTPSTGDNYACVDDTPGAPDDDTTYVHYLTTPMAYDYYNLTTTTLPEGAIIDSLSVYSRFRSSDQNYPCDFRTGLRLNSTDSLGTLHEGPANESWQNYNDTITRPGGGSWVGDDFDDLQVIVGIAGGGSAAGRCTQAYVIINYHIPATEVSVTGIATGELDTITLSVTPDDLLEDFEWGNDGDSLATDGGDIDWTVTTDGTSVAEIDTAQKVSGTRSARLYRDGTNNVIAEFDKSPMSQSEPISFMARKDTNAQMYCVHGNGIKRIVFCTNTNEGIYYIDDGGNHDTGYDVLVGIWHEFWIDNVDWSTGTYDIYLDGVLVVKANMETLGTYANVFALTNYAGTSEVWIDDITSNGVLTLDINGESDSATLVRAVPDNANDIISFENDTVLYAGSQEIEIDGVQKQYVEWEYGATFEDQSGNGNDATPTFRTTSSDADVSAELVSFGPVNPAIGPAYAVSDAASFYTGNITANGTFSGSTIEAGGPPGAVIIDEAEEEADVPGGFVWGWVAIVTLLMIGLFITWMERKHGQGTGTLIFRIFITTVVFGLLITWGKFDWWMLIFYFIIVAAFALMSRQYDWGGAGGVSQYGWIGFCATSWVGLTLINRILEGELLTSAETSWANNFAFTQEFKAFDVFTVPVLNFQFFTEGIPSLLRWDYSFFGGQAQIIQYGLYSITAIVSFILFLVLITILFNTFRTSAT